MICLLHIAALCKLVPFQSVSWRTVGVVYAHCRNRLPVNRIRFIHPVLLFCQLISGGGGGGEGGSEGSASVTGPVVECSECSVTADVT